MRSIWPTRTRPRTRRCATRSTSDVLPKRRGAKITTSWPLRASDSSSATSSSRSVKASSRASAPKRNGLAGERSGTAAPADHYSRRHYASDDNRRRRIFSLVAPPQQRHLERPQLTAREAADEHRVLVHDPPRALLVGRLEHGDAGVRLPERRAGQDQRPVVEQSLEALEVDAPHGPLLVGHRRGEVLARGMDEVDPRQHLMAPCSYGGSGPPRPASTAFATLGPLVHRTPAGRRGVS